MGIRIKSFLYTVDSIEENYIYTFILTTYTFLGWAPLGVEWFVSLVRKPSRVSSNLIGCPIHTTISHI